MIFLLPFGGTWTRSREGIDCVSSSRKNQTVKALVEASCPTAVAQSFAAALGAVSTKMPGRGGRSIVE